jgi:hypothetical protein
VTLEQVIAVLTFAGTLAGAGIGAYVAVKVELATVSERAGQALREAERAHARLDALFARPALT